MYRARILERGYWDFSMRNMRYEYYVIEKKLAALLKMSEINFHDGCFSVWRKIVLKNTIKCCNASACGLLSNYPF